MRKRASTCWSKVCANIVCAFVCVYVCVYLKIDV